MAKVTVLIGVPTSCLIGRIEAIRNVFQVTTELAHRALSLHFLLGPSKMLRGGKFQQC